MNNQTPSYQGLPGILPDHEIIRLADLGMIYPFERKQVSDVDGRKVLSYGVSSYGYDARVDYDFKIFDSPRPASHQDPGWPGHLVSHYGADLLDPKNFDEKAFHTALTENDGTIIIPPHGFALACTVETFDIPRDVLVICVGKSSLARIGMIVNITPLEPQWRGQVTLEFSNTTQFPVKMYPNEGACQFLFLRASSECEVSYADRKGKYQDQIGVTLPRMMK